MAIWKRKTSTSDDVSPQIGEEEYGKTEYPAGEYPKEGVMVEPGSGHTKLTRGLKARHITMIAIGGAIGTGLIIGTGSALAKAG
jgi:amino acid transporter